MGALSVGEFRLCRSKIQYVLVRSAFKNFHIQSDFRASNPRLIGYSNTCRLLVS